MGGRQIKDSQPIVTGKLSISPKTMALVKRGMWDVVNGERGTARGARFLDVPISGKTGTAQVVSRKENSEDDPDLVPDHLKAHAWFVGIAPTDTPKIAVAVIVEHGEHGSGAAAPIAREMMKIYLYKEQLKSGPRMVATQQSSELN